jgi:hypothetical protein
VIGALTYVADRCGTTPSRNPSIAPISGWRADSGGNDSDVLGEKDVFLVSGSDPINGVDRRGLRYGKRRIPRVDRQNAGLTAFEI